MDSATVTARLGEVSAADSRQLDRVCEEVAGALHRDGTVPEFDVRSADFAADPYVICADRYWRLRFLEVPSVRTAAECARWMRERITAEHRTEIAERWALGYAFITKDTVESARELTQAAEEIGAGEVAYFTTLYQAGKLRSNFWFDELHQFLSSSMLALAAGPHREGPLFLALRSFAAFGTRSITAEHAVELLDLAWNSPDRTRSVVDICLNGIHFSAPFDTHGELLRTRAEEAVRDHPRDHMFHFRLACGRHMCGLHDLALDSIDTALALLPAVGSRGSHTLLQEQYLSKRAAILDSRVQAGQDAEQQLRWERQEQANRDLETTLHTSSVRAVELVAVFTAAIAFAVGSLQVTLTGNLSLRDRLWLLGAQGLGLAGFALLIVGGTWVITRRRRER